jgi:hypothetical protein
MSTKMTKIAEGVAQAGGFLCGNTDDPMEHIKALEAKYPALDRTSLAYQSVCRRRSLWSSSSVSPKR